MHLSLGYKLQLRVAFVDMSGNPAAAPVTPTWISDNSDIVQCVVESDGLSAWLQGLSLGRVTVKISAGSFSQLFACEVIDATDPARMVLTVGAVEPLY